MGESSFYGWTFSDIIKAGKPCRIYTELNGQFETEDMEAFGHGSFHFYKKKVQANAIQVGCSAERKGCKVRALISLSGQFLKYLGEPHRPPTHNHFPFHGLLRNASVGCSPHVPQPIKRIMTPIGKNRQGYEFYKCPRGYGFFVNGITRLKTDRVEIEMSCAERRDGCKARITCNSENLEISRERGQHNHIPLPEDTLRTRNFEIHRLGQHWGRMDTQNVHVQNQRIREGSLERTETDSSAHGLHPIVIDTRTPRSEIIESEDAPSDPWADPVAVFADHNYTLDPRYSQQERTVYDTNLGTQEFVVVSNDTSFGSFDEVPGADLFEEIPFDEQGRQIACHAFGADGRELKVWNGSNKMYLPCVERF